MEKFVQQKLEKLPSVHPHGERGRNVVGFFVIGGEIKFNVSANSKTIDLITIPQNKPHI